MNDDHDKTLSPINHITENVMESKDVKPGLLPIFKPALTMATSALSFMLDTSNVFGEEPLDGLDDKPGKQLVIAKSEDAEPGPINHMYKDVMGLILYETSKNVNPRRLTSVCKSWRGVLGLNEEAHGELHYSIMSSLHSTMKPFMQLCMNTYWDNLFYNGILRYTPEDGSEGVTLKFSDCKDGTFDLSTCGDTGQDIVITTNMDRFFKVGKKNDYTTMILITLRHRVEQVSNSPDHPFHSAMIHWDADCAPVGMFWRQAYQEDLTWMGWEHQTRFSMKAISSQNLYEIWKPPHWEDKSYPYSAYETKGAARRGIAHFDRFRIHF